MQCYGSRRAADTRAATGRRTLALVVCVVACAAVLAGGARAKPSAAAEPAAPSRARVAIFAVDAADWLTIDRLIAQGRLPTFARLKQVSAVGALQADAPLLSPIIWTTMATGREPMDHGVLDFMADRPGGGQAPVTGHARRAKAVWEIWSQAGWPVLVTGWWATWPADRVRGTMVSDRLAGIGAWAATRDDPRSTPGMVFPAERLPEVARLVVAPDSLDYPAVARLLPMSQEEFTRAIGAARPSASALFRQPLAHFRSALAATRSYRAISTTLAAHDAPALWATYYEVVDVASHLFIRDRVRGDAAIAAAYDEVDLALADTARVLPGDTCVIVISDHGFYSPDAGIREDPADLTRGATAWHRPYGIVAVTTAAAVRDQAKRPRPSAIGRMTPLDLVPSLLARAGLPLAADMPGRAIPAISGTSNASANRVASYGGHDLLDTSVAGSPAADRAEVERLRALGYIGNQAPTSLGRVNLGEYLYRKRNFEGARRELEAVLRSDPLNERAALWLARTYTDLGRQDDALRIYDRMLRAAATQSDDRHVDPLLYLAATDLDVAARRASGALERLRRAPDALQATPELMTANGAVAEAQGRAADAERWYRRAQATNAEDVESLQRLVDLLVATGRPTAAISVALASARRYPSSPIRLSLAGEAELASRRYVEAERHFEAALALASDSVSVRVALGRSQLLQQRADAALETLAVAPASPDVEVLRGTAYAQKRNWAAAVSAYERAAAVTAAGTELLNALGNALLQAGRAREAAGTFERSLAMNPDQPSIRQLLQQAARASQRR